MANLANLRFRKFFDKMKWPLVTRARYQQNKDNYEAELKATEQLANEYLKLLNDGEYGELRAQLTEQRNVNVTQAGIILRQTADIERLEQELQNKERAA